MKAFYESTQGYSNNKMYTEIQWILSKRFIQYILFPFLLYMILLITRKFDHTGIGFWFFNFYIIAAMLLVLVIALPKLRAAGRIRLRAYFDRIEISFGLWPANLQDNLRIPTVKITRIAPELFVDCSLFENLERTGTDLPGSKGRGEWRGWRALMATMENSAPALLIETTDGNWLIGCPDPYEAVGKLRKHYDPHTDIQFPLKQV